MESTRRDDLLEWCEERGMDITDDGEFRATEPGLKIADFKGSYRVEIEHPEIDLKMSVHADNTAVKGRDLALNPGDNRTVLRSTRPSEDQESHHGQ